MKRIGKPILPRSSLLAHEFAVFSTRFMEWLCVWFAARPLLLFRGRSFKAAIILCALILLDASTTSALVQITQVGNVNFGTWSGGSLSPHTVNVCIYNSDAPGSYAIKASGSGPSFSFKIRRGSTSDYIDYEVDWQASGGGWSSLTANVTSGTFSGASQVIGCGGGSNASYRISISESELLSVSAGSYSGSLTLELVAR